MIWTLICGLQACFLFAARERGHTSGCTCASVPQIIGVQNTGDDGDDTDRRDDRRDSRHSFFELATPSMCGRDKAPSPNILPLRLPFHESLREVPHQSTDSTKACRVMFASLFVVRNLVDVACQGSR